MNAHERLKLRSSGACVAINIPVDKLTKEYETALAERDALKSTPHRNRAENIVRDRTIRDLLETLISIDTDLLPLPVARKIERSIKDAQHSIGMIEYTRK